jgi:hypothetical protein
MAPVVAKSDYTGLIHVDRQGTTDCIYAPLEDEKLIIGIPNHLGGC